MTSITMTGFRGFENRNHCGVVFLCVPPPNKYQTSTTKYSKVLEPCTWWVDPKVIVACLWNMVARFWAELFHATNLHVNFHTTPRTSAMPSTARAHGEEKLTAVGTLQQ